MTIHGSDAPAPRAESPELPGFDDRQIRRLSGPWSDRGLWEDIEHLSHRFWTARPAAQTLAWHHLVLAVGNFKRDAGRRLHPAAIADRAVPQLERPEAVEIPGVGLPLTVDDVATWAQLASSLRGAGVATTTTLLAALWPGRHFVYDWRVNAAVNGLRITAGLDPTNGVDPSGIALPPASLTDYDQIRGWLLDAAAATEQPLEDVERALYRLSQQIPTDPKRTWTGYATAIADVVHPSHLA